MRRQHPQNQKLCPNEQIEQILSSSGYSLKTSKGRKKHLNSKLREAENSVKTFLDKSEGRTVPNVVLRDMV